MRAVRRHHEERVKAKYRRKLRYWDRLQHWMYHWESRREGNVLFHRCVVTPDGAEKREKYIIERARKMAHHSKPQCPFRGCCGERYNRRRKYPYNFMKDYE